MNQPTMKMKRQNPFMELIQTFFLFFGATMSLFFVALLVEMVA